MIKQVCILYNQKEATHYKERIETLVNQKLRKIRFPGPRFRLDDFKLSFLVTYLACFS